MEPLVVQEEESLTALSTTSNNMIATSNNNEKSNNKPSKNLIVDIGTNIESHRCLATELEACISLTSILLQNPNGLSSLLPELQQQQQQQDENDQEISQQQKNSENNATSNIIPKGVLDAIESLQKISSNTTSLSTTDDNSITTTKTKTVLGNNSQMYKACRATALKTSLKRTNEIIHKLKNKMMEDSYPFMEQLKQLQHEQQNQDDGEGEEVVSKMYLEAFYEKLHGIKEYHARYGNNNISHDSNTSGLFIAGDQQQEQRPIKRQRYGNVEADGYDLSSILQTSCSTIPNGTLFSTEEVLGKYLDFISIHGYILVDIPDFFSSTNNNSYVDFLQILSKLDSNNSDKTNTTFSIDWKLSHRKKYNHVLSMLRTYLQDFLSRAFPLLAMDKDIIQPALLSLRQKQQDDGDVSSSGINWDNIQSVDDLIELYTPNQLKTQLTLLNMKCGGTALERAKRLFQTKETPLAELPSKLFVKKETQEKSNLQYLEVIVFALLQQLRPTLESTIRRAERRLTQTISEKERELEEEMFGDTSILTLPNKGNRGGDNQEGGDDEDEDDDEEDDDAPIYNPKGVPLGWDGKPIPYWLFKLHGLNHFFTCEICGNESYRGRHNFEKHFTESKHAYGMRCLGIPNTKHFHGITDIDDAKKLWETLCNKMENDVFDAEKEEEYEDSHGNVLSRAAYEDLARQGML